MADKQEMNVKEMENVAGGKTIWDSIKEKPDLIAKPVPMTGPTKPDKPGGGLFDLEKITDPSIIEKIVSHPSDDSSSK